MSYSQLSMPERLVSIKEALETVLSDPALSEPMAAKGYPEEEINKGLALQGGVAQLFQSRFVKYGIGVESTGTLAELTKTVRKNAVPYRKIALSVVSETPGLPEQLRLDGTLSNKRDNLLLQVRHFYERILLLPDVMAKVTPLGLTEAVIAAQLELVNALESAMKAQQHKRAEAKAMRAQRDKALAELDSWSVEFFGTARLVFRNDKEQLDKLGL